MYNKQIYVSPLTIRRTIEIESCLMAASKEEIKDEKIEVTIEKQLDSFLEISRAYQNSHS